MLLEDHFKIGDKVKIGVYRDSSHVVFYPTKILDINIDQKQISFYNINQEVGYKVEEGHQISVLKEEGSLVFFFHTIFIEYQDDPIDALVLRIPSDIERMQRREFFRLSLSVKMSLRKEGEDEIYLGETLDLSGNGLSVDLDAPLEEGDGVVVQLPLTKDLFIDDIYGTVSRVGKGELLPYRYGIQFTNIEKDKREKIVAYIFEIQRMRIKLAKNM